MKGFADPWAVDSGQEDRAGDWAYGGTPLMARIAALDVRPGDLSPLKPVATTLPPGPSDGDDILTGAVGDDTLVGLVGDDRSVLDLRNGVLHGGTGCDTFIVNESIAATIKLASGVVPATGHGTDSIQGVENVTGGSGSKQFIGDLAGNLLSGRGGDDSLDERKGSDILIGGNGRDSLVGGADRDTDLFVFVSLKDSAKGIRRDAILRADTTGDGRADFEIRWAGVTSLTIDDLLL